MVSPYLPLLFMGEEWAEPHPFLYFISHTEEELVAAVRKGRREEFAAFHAQGEAPDPAAEETFQQSKLQWSLVQSGQHQTMFRFYQALIALRKKEPALRGLNRKNIEVQEDAAKNTLLLHRWHQEQHLLCLMNFSKKEQQMTPLPEANEWHKCFDSADPKWGGPNAAPNLVTNNETITVQPESFLIYLNTHV